MCEWKSFASGTQGNIVGIPKFACPVLAFLLPHFQMSFSSEAMFQCMKFAGWPPEGLTYKKVLGTLEVPPSSTPACFLWSTGIQMCCNGLRTVVFLLRNWNSKTNPVSLESQILPLVSSISVPDADVEIYSVDYVELHSHIIGPQALLLVEQAVDWPQTYCFDPISVHRLMLWPCQPVHHFSEPLVSSVSLRHVSTWLVQLCTPSPFLISSFTPLNKSRYTAHKPSLLPPHSAFFYILFLAFIHVTSFINFNCDILVSKILQ